MIIDCHCHAGAGPGFKVPWQNRAPLAVYQQRAAAAGIDRTVLFAAFHDNYAVANAVIHRLIQWQPERFLGFAFVHSERDRGRILALLQLAIAAYGFVGIKVHRRDARITREVCDAARVCDVPVLYDVMGETGICEWLAQEYPDVAFIIPHLGSFDDDWRAQLRLIEQLKRHENLFTDSAGVRHFDLLQRAVQRAGPHKLLFGSDGPWLHPAVEIAKIRLLKLAPHEEALVLGENFLRLIGNDNSIQIGRRPATFGATHL